MGHDKAFVAIHGVPLWQRQLQVLQQLGPQETFIAGPARPEWMEACDEVLQDEQEGAGPLAGLVVSLRRCTTPLLVALAVDLPSMTTPYLRQLLGRCEPGRGIVPVRADRVEPLAAVYPTASLALAESLLLEGICSLQVFARRCAAQNLILKQPIQFHEEPLFLNMNTPADLAAANE